MVPLQRDLQEQQQQLRLWPEAEKSTLALDLRSELHLSRSHLLHRLSLLEVPWGRELPVRGQSGTYTELWELQWLPELSVRVVQAAVWGNTVQDAVAAFVEDLAGHATDLRALIRLIDQVALADLPESVSPLLARIEELAAVSIDVPHMMDTLPPLAQALRYGNLRQTAEHQNQMRRVFAHLLARVCIGLPGACASLDDDAGTAMFERLIAVDSAVHTLQDSEQTGPWQAALAQLADQRPIHGVVAGRACRLLLDATVFSAGEVTLRMRRTLAHGLHDRQQMKDAADWLDGFLRDSGLILVHDASLWRLVDSWIAGLERGQFEELLPLLRRVFSTFSEAIRQQLQERVRHGIIRANEQAAATRFNHEQADAVLEYVAQLFGL
jgi:hypothetical protein